MRRLLIRLLLGGVFVAQSLVLPFTPASASYQVFVYVTFYGFDDNDNGDPLQRGTDVISNPTIHKGATEDLGTFDHPGTMAADKRFLPPGTKIYVPALKRYYIMEDTCTECTRDWEKKKLRIDLYLDGRGKKLADCENALTMERAKIIIDPRRDLPVKPGPACASH